MSYSWNSNPLYFFAVIKIKWEEGTWMCFANSVLGKVDNWFRTQNESLKPKQHNLSGILSTDIGVVGDKRAALALHQNILPAHGHLLGSWVENRIPRLGIEELKIVQRAPKTTFHPVWIFNRLSPQLWWNKTVTASAQAEGTRGEAQNPLLIYSLLHTQSFPRRLTPPG